MSDAKFLAMLDPEGPERCGVLLACGTIAEMPNLHPSPMEGFAFDAAVLGSPEIVATWHTHPRTSPNLSREDYHMFKQYPHLGHFIISPLGVWLFVSKDDILLRHGNHSLWLSERTSPAPDPG